MISIGFLMTTLKEVTRAQALLLLQEALLLRARLSVLPEHPVQAKFPLLVHAVQSAHLRLVIGRAEIVHAAVE